ncbi:MAG: beta-propeller domain-containing protein, partial [Thaumarchaeota archaeon]|nr:beta-propeller domain-containing protein [Nitrososphaerota archaeon]
MEKKILALVVTVAILLAADVGAILLWHEEPTPTSNTGLRPFSSQKDLENFINDGLKRAKAEGLPYFGFGALAESAVARQGAQTDGSGAADFSATNIQVEGVDEADIVKTDGKFIYLVSNNRLFIVDAYPAEEMRMVSTTVVNGNIMGLFVDEDRLVIFEGSTYAYAEPAVRSGAPIVDRSVICLACGGFAEGFHIKVYNISNRSSPSQVREVSLNGTYVSSRMIGDWVYTVARQPAIYWIMDDPSVILPAIGVEGDVKTVPPTSVYYSNNSTDVPVDYTMIVALNVQADSGEPELRVVLTGIATNTYVSRENIYVAVPKGGWWRSEGSTAIHRIAVDGQRIELEASGEVPGRVLNQFSMDEYNDHFRIATTVGRVSRGMASSSSNVYVLDQDMKTIGRLEE